jgi:hypothetical protein
VPRHAFKQRPLLCRSVGPSMFALVCASLFGCVPTPTWIERDHAQRYGVIAVPSGSIGAHEGRQRAIAMAREFCGGDVEVLREVAHERMVGKSRVSAHSGGSATVWGESGQARAGHGLATEVERRDFERASRVHFRCVSDVVYSPGGWSCFAARVKDEQAAGRGSSTVGTCWLGPTTCEARRGQFAQASQSSEPANGLSVEWVAPRCSRSTVAWCPNTVDVHRSDTGCSSSRQGCEESIRAAGHRTWCVAVTTR